MTEATDIYIRNFKLKKIEINTAEPVSNFENKSTDVKVSEYEMLVNVYEFLYLLLLPV
jgi:hypothetical protein